jgi:hypothetical protein
MIRRLVAIVLLLTGAIPVVVAMAAICGLGLLRDANVVPLVIAPVGIVLLPCLGLATLFGTRPIGLAATFWIWPILVLLGLPAYFPGERSQALSTGLGVVASVHGPETAERAAEIGETLAHWLGPEPQIAREPATPIQAQPEPAPLPARSPESLHDNQVALPFEGEGRTLRIPVVFENRFGDSIETWMLFDTGATFTTLNRETLESLDITVPDDAPTVTLHTANGERTAHLVLLEKTWLGGFPVVGVTVAICEACASEDTGVSGLLGNNVSGQFTVTLDPDRQEMVLEPRKGPTDRHLDIGPWIDIDAQATAWPDGRVEVAITVSNDGNRVVETAEVGIRCGKEHFSASLTRIHPGDLRRTRVSLPRGTKCETYEVALDSARW